MSNFDEKYSINRALSEEQYPFYEDTHDENGSYTERLKEFTANTINTNVVGREETFNPRPNNIVIEETKVDETKEKEEKVKEVAFKNIAVFEPQLEKEAESMIKLIKNGDPIIIKMLACSDEVAQRILDFVSGATFALDGIMRKLAHGLFLSVPKNVKVIIEEEIK